MASLYSNENLSIDLVDILREFNHDVLASYQASQANQGIPDEEVLAGFPRLRVAPDVMVIFNVQPGGRDNYKTWEEGQVPAVIY
jgi:Domain of unknown function (DUF5615)